MKIGNKKKLLNIIIILTSVVLSILTMMSILLFNTAKKSISLNIKSLSGNNYISGIRIGETTYYVKDFSEAYDLELLDKDKNSIEDDRLVLKQGEGLNFDVNAIHNVNIYFDKDMSDGKLEINYDGHKKIIDTNNKKSESYFSVFNTLSSLLINQIKTFNTINYLIICLLILLFCFIYKMLINKILDIINKVKDNGKISISQIIFCFFSYFLINLLCMIPVIEVLNKWYFLIIAAQIIVVIYFLKDLLKNKLHCIFAFLSIILCINMAILIPPFHVPDEFAHFVKAYSIFNKSDIAINKYKHTIKMPSNLVRNSKKYVYDLHNPSYKLSIKEYFADFSTMKVSKEKVEIGFENTAKINSFAYIPSGFVIKIGTLFNLPCGFLNILSRIINLLIFIILGFLALKIIPYFKRILFIIMLFPITIQQISAVNQDSLTLSIIFIFLALILKEIFDMKSKILKKNIYIIIILSLFLGMCKPVYFFASLLILLIPNKRFNNKKEIIIYKLLPIILCFAFSCFKLLEKSANPTSPFVKDLITFSYALHHPLNIIKICLKTFNIRGALDLLTGQLNLFGWSTVYYDNLSAFIIYNLYLFVLICDNENVKKYTLFKRGFTVLVAVLVFMFIYASAMFGFSTTTIYSDIIGGLQSRYFIPVTLLLTIGLSGNYISTKFKNKNILPILLIIFTYAISFYTIIKGFFV